LKDIPEGQEYIRNWYLRNLKTPENEYTKYHPVQSNKQGGILKAQEGSKLSWNDDLYSLVDWDLSKRYRNKYEQENLSLEGRNTNATDTIAPHNSKYDPEPGGQ